MCMPRHLGATPGPPEQCQAQEAQPNQDQGDAYHYISQRRRRRPTCAKALLSVGSCLLMSGAANTGSR